MTLRLDVITLFPDAFGSVLASSIVGRALREGRVRVVLTNLRDFAADARGTVDDKPFGGGPGMVFLCEPVFRAVEHVQGLDERPGHVLLLTTQGEQRLLAWQLFERRDIRVTGEGGWLLPALPFRRRAQT